MPLALAGALTSWPNNTKKWQQARKITCAVSIGPRDAGGFGLAVKIHVEDKTLPQSELETLAQEAHEKICPYSNATRGNVPVELEIVGSS